MTQDTISERERQAQAIQIIADLYRAADGSARIAENLEAGVAALRNLDQAIAQVSAEGRQTSPSKWVPVASVPAPNAGSAFHAHGPTLIHADFNPWGVVEACFDGDKFIGAIWDGQFDQWVTQPIEFTHWCAIEGPQASAGRLPTTPETVGRTPEWGLANVYTIARRRLRAPSLPESEREWWQHVVRIAEESGVRQPGVLRHSVPTELTEGEPSSSTGPTTPEPEQDEEDTDRVVAARIDILSYHLKRGLLFPGMDERNQELHGLLDALIAAVRSDCDRRRDSALLEAQGRAALAERRLAEVIKPEVIKHVSGGSDDARSNLRPDQPSDPARATLGAVDHGEPEGEVAAPPQASEKCQNCEHWAICENWGGTHDQISLARNPRLIQRWCRRCVLTAQVAYMRPLVAKLTEAELSLAALNGVKGTDA